MNAYFVIIVVIVKTVCERCLSDQFTQKLELVYTPGKHLKNIKLV